MPLDVLLDDEKAVAEALVPLFARMEKRSVSPLTADASSFLIHTLHGLQRQRRGAELEMGRAESIKPPPRYAVGREAWQVRIVTWALHKDLRELAVRVRRARGHRCDACGSPKAGVLNVVRDVNEGVDYAVGPYCAAELRRVGLLRGEDD